VLKSKPEIEVDVEAFQDELNEVEIALADTDAEKARWEALGSVPDEAMYATYFDLDEDQAANLPPTLFVTH